MWSGRRIARRSCGARVSSPHARRRRLDPDVLTIGRSSGAFATYKRAAAVQPPSGWPSCWAIPSAAADPRRRLRRIPRRGRQDRIQSSSTTRATSGPPVACCSSRTTRMMLARRLVQGVDVLALRRDRGHRLRARSGERRLIWKAQVELRRSTKHRHGPAALRQQGAGLDGPRSGRQALLQPEVGRSRLLAGRGDGKDPLVVRHRADAEDGLVQRRPASWYPPAVDANGDVYLGCREPRLWPIGEDPNAATPPRRESVHGLARPSSTAAPASSSGTQVISTMSATRPHDLAGALPTVRRLAARDRRREDGKVFAWNAAPCKRSGQAKVGKHLETTPCLLPNGRQVTSLPGRPATSRRLRQQGTVFVQGATTFGLPDRCTGGAFHANTLAHLPCADHELRAS